MSIINTLREKMGRMLVIVVGLSIMAFVLTDLLGPQSSLLGNNKREVGEIAGEAISQEQFVNVVDNLKFGFQQQYGTPPNEFMMQSIRNQAWDQLIFDIMYNEIYEDAGVAVTSDERVDMVQGDNPAAFILQNFGDPNTGFVDRQQLTQYLANLQFNPQARIQWEIWESQMGSQRMRDKYDNLLLKTSYATLAQAQQEYNNQLGSVDIDYAYFPYAAVADSSVSASDAELRAYLNEHSNEYQVEQSRSMEYVIFPVIPSAEDSAKYQATVDELRADFAAAENDSSFAITETEQGVGFATYDPRSLPADLASNIEGMNEGEIFGPTLTNGVYTMYKLSAKERGETRFVKASHILIKTDETTSAVDKAAARNEANSLLRRIRNGENFEQLARENSDDNTAALGGDLNWYEEDTGWDPDFQSAVFGRTRKGLIPRVVESQFGYHIIRVDEVPTYDRYKVGTIQVILTPSFETTNAVFQEAAAFEADATSYQSYTDITNEKGYSVFSGDNITANQQVIGGLNDARSIVIWLFAEAKREDVKLFELNDNYVVAVHTNRVEKGTATLESVSAEIEQKVRDQKKLEVLKTRVGGLSGTLQDMVNGFGPQARFYTTSALRLSSNSLPNVGTAPEAIGAAFALANAGDRTAVIETELGVVVIELKAKNAAPEIADYTAYENQLIQRMIGQVRTSLIQSIRERANVTDERYKFY